MASIGAGYDLSSSTYSPEGRIFQVEYAAKAVDTCGTIIGLKVKDGVVLAVEKLVHSKLLKKQVNRRIAMVDLHAGVVSAGLTADCRQLANRARAEAANHRENFENGITGSQLAERMGLFLHAYTSYSSVRPFGATTILGVYDKSGPHLYMLEPSGVHWEYKGCAAGKGRAMAKTEIEKLDLANMTARQAIFEVTRILHLCHEESKDKDFELEVSWIAPETGFEHRLVESAVLEEAERAAKEAILAAMDVEN